MMDVTVEIHCAACGSGNYSIPGGTAGGPSLTCMDCGRNLGSMEELAAEMLEQALAHSAEALRHGIGSTAQGKGA
jgi:hypothetical protein